MPNPALRFEVRGTQCATAKRREQHSSLYLTSCVVTNYKEMIMSLATKTAVAVILRQYNQGLLSRSDAYHRISDVYYNLHSH